ncbi:unnamed protein product, partial [Ixodes hexagonus]
VEHPYKPQVFDEFVISGNTAVFRCSVPSFVKELVDFVSWHRDDGLVITATTDRGKYSVLPSGELYIRNVGPSDKLRNYHCKTKHKLTNEVIVSASSGRLFIQAPQGTAAPKITDSHPFVQVIEGQDMVELACAAQGFPVPSFSWYREVEGRLVDLSLDQRTAQVDGSLFLSAPVVRDSGKYFCVVNNSVGEEQVRTTLSVTASLRAEIRPAVQTADVGHPVTFNCTTSGQPVRTVTWYKDQHRLDATSRVSMQASGLVLRISSVLRQDAGVYQCYVHNEADSAQASAELRLGDVAPFLTSTFAEQTSLPGNSVSLRCSASGSPLPQVTWTLYGSSVPEHSRFRVGDFVTSDSTVVSFVNVTELRVEDGGEYVCRAANAVGETEHAARINVHGPPMVRQMSNVTVISGRGFRKVCPVAGFPIHSVVWLKGDNKLPTNHRQQVSHATLTVHNAQRASDEGEYSCVARSGNLSARGSTYVHVQVPPVIDSQMLPDMLTSNQGMNVKMLCSVVQGDPPVSLRWLHGDHVLSRSSSVSLQSLEDSSVLTLKGVSMRESGNYTCEASNRALTVNRTVTLVVNVPPMWTTEPNNGNVVLGETVVLDCAADGFPLPRIDWKRAEGDEPRNFELLTTGYRVQMLSNGSLLVQDAEISDAGFYLCEAHNGIGAGLSRVISLSVNVPPSFSTKFSSQNVKRGQDALLRCDASGDPELIISWEKDKQPIDLTIEKRYALLEENLDRRLSSSLTISSTERWDGALYTCIVRNPFGSDETNVQLLVQEPPSAPTEVRAVKVASRTLEIVWSPSYNGNSPIRKYHVHFTNATTSWEPASSTLQLSVPGTENRATIYKLHPMTTYRIRITAENTLGHSQPSDTMEVTTSEEAPGGPPVHVKIEATSSQSLKVSWEPPRKELHYGQLRGYYIGYKEESKTGAEFQYKNVEAMGLDSGSERRLMSHLTNLKRKTRYTVRVQAYNSEGAGPMSDDVSATTLDAVPPTSPALRLKTSSTTSITVEWERIEDDISVRDYALHYQVEGGEWKEMALSTSANKYTLDGLKCGSLYSLFMTATNSLGTAEPRDIIYARTKGAAPVSSKLEEFIVLNATFVSLNLFTWQSGGCPILHFGVHLRPTGAHEWKLMSDRVPAGQRRLELKHLTPGKEYEVRVSAYSEAGITEADFRFKTFNTSHIADYNFNHGSSEIQQTGSDVPLYRNLSVLLPVAVSVLVVIIVVTLVVVCLRKQNDTYGTTESNHDHQIDDPLRKCRGSVESVGMEEFCAKKDRLQMQLEDGCTKATSYYSSGAQNPASMLSRSGNGHEYAEPYAVLKARQQRMLEESEYSDAVALGHISRWDGASYATIKRSPPRSHIASFCRGKTT